MSTEIGGLATRGAAGGVSIAGMQSNPEEYINWFDVVHSMKIPWADEIFYTYADITDVISPLVGVAVILSTVKALFGVKAMKITLMAISALCVTILLTGCMTATAKFPQKMGYSSGSCATVGGAAKLFAGDGQTGHVTQFGDGETKATITITDKKCSVVSVTTKGAQTEIEKLEKAAESEGG